MIDDDVTTFGTRRAVAVASVFVALVALNALLPHLPSHERFWTMLAGAWIFSPILCGFWAVVGSGPFAIRLLTIVPVMWLAVLVPVSFRRGDANSNLPEWVVFMIAGTVIFIVAMASVWIAQRRRIARISRPLPDQNANSLNLQFGMRQLLLLMTLWAIFFGTASRLPFPTDDMPRHLGPEFLVLIVAFGGAVATMMLLPILFVPWFMLCPTINVRSLWRALGIWAIMTGIGVWIWDSLDPHSLRFVVIMTLCLQLGAAVTGSVLALPLRLMGFRAISVAATPSTFAKDSTITPHF